MKLYKVNYFQYDLANSLLPPRDPLPGEEAPIDDALEATSTGYLVDLLVRWGYTTHQARQMYAACFSHYWNNIGIHEIRSCNVLIENWIRTIVIPACVQAREMPPPTIPPTVVYIVVVAAMILVVALLVAPDWTENYRWYPPCNLYLGTYDEDMTWLCLAGVSGTLRPYYEALVHEGAVITAHTYEYDVPPVRSDILHFWGTLEWRCWQIPWFRVYRTQFANCTFVGILEHVSAHVYRLRQPFIDHWAPTFPMVVAPENYCRVFSPCG